MDAVLANKAGGTSLAAPRRARQEPSEPDWKLLVPIWLDRARTNQFIIVLHIRWLPYSHKNLHFGLGPFIASIGQICICIESHFWFVSYWATPSRHEWKLSPLLRAHYRMPSHHEQLMAGFTVCLPVSWQLRKRGRGREGNLIYVQPAAGQGQIIEVHLAIVGHSVWRLLPLTGSTSLKWISFKMCAPTWRIGW